MHGHSHFPAVTMEMSSEATVLFLLAGQIETVPKRHIVTVVLFVCLLVCLRRIYASSSKSSLFYAWYDCRAGDAICQLSSSVVSADPSATTTRCSDSMTTVLPLLLPPAKKEKQTNLIMKIQFLWHLKFLFTLLGVTLIPPSWSLEVNPVLPLSPHRPLSNKEKGAFIEKRSNCFLRFCLYRLCACKGSLLI